MINDSSGHPVLRSAALHARKLRHHYIGTEHLFLGVLSEPGDASEFMEGYGVKYSKVFDTIRDFVGEGESEPITNVLPKTPSARRVCKGARRLAKNRSSKDVLPVDILAVILHEDVGVTQRVLTKYFQVELDALRRSVGEL